MWGSAMRCQVGQVPDLPAPLGTLKAVLVTKKKYVVIIEEGPADYSAYVPDLPGCVSTGRTLAHIEKNIR
jgi:hypothetical protein